MEARPPREAPLSRLRPQLLLTALLPVLLVSLLLTWPVVALYRTQLMEQARLRTLQAGRSSEARIAERLGFAQLLVGLVADRPALTRVLGADDRPGLAAFVRQTLDTTLFDLVTVLDAAGAPLAQEGDTRLWRGGELSQTTQIWGDPERGLVMQVSAPILLDEQPGGTLVGTLAIGEPFLSGARQRSGLDQGLFVGDTLVASTLEGRLATGARLLLAVGDTESLEDVPGSREALLGAVPYLVHYQPVRSLNDVRIATIEVLLPLAPVQAAQRQSTLAILGGVLLAVGVAALLSWLLAQRITRPIRRLGQAARRIGAGDFVQPVAVQGAAEITNLSGAVDQMRQQLRITHTALAAETARYLNILESSRDAILVLDAAERVTMLNRSAERMLGCLRATVAGQPLAQLVTLHGGEPLAPARIPLVGSLHLAIQQPGRRVLTVEATRTAIDAAADDAHGEQIVVLRDISDAVALGALKDAFLANVTHEFRTPLSALIASLEILRNEHGDLSPAEQQQMLAALHIGVRRLDTLVQNLLDSASIQAGYFRVEPEASALAPLVEEAVELMRPLAQQRGQTIQVVLAPDLPAVLADDRRIVQVLVNLLSNASKFGPRGDTLTLAAEVAADQVVVAVTDHGPGIAESRQANLFERFLRPGSKTVDAQGVGLGLAIVKAIVERHGDTVRVHTDGARGTTFSFGLQVAPAIGALGQEWYANAAG